MTLRTRLLINSPTPRSTQRPLQRPLTERQAASVSSPASFWTRAVVPMLLVLQGCATLPSDQPHAADVAAAWQAPRAHNGTTTDLSRWWQQFDDPLLAQLVSDAQARNPSMAQAAARIEQARALARAAGAPLWPGLNAIAGNKRTHDASISPSGSTYTTNTVGLDASWEIDLFGANRQNRHAAQERVRGSEAAWHDARVSLAAEVANTYVALRTCEAVLDIYTEDATSLQQTSALTQQKAKAGFDATANAALADASAAEASNRVVSQRADCDVTLKSLVALTLRPEPLLRQALDAYRARLPQPAAFAVNEVPAATLAQRPDLAAAQRDIAAAVADVGSAEANRWPRLSLTGSIGRVQLRSGGGSVESNTWSIGPSLVAPLFDAGARKAQADVARARYDEAQALWQTRALAAVREVEESLVRLTAAEQREADAQRAANGYATFFKAANTQWRVGAGSLLDLEQARRSALNAKASLVQVQHERVAAWLALYKAVGGGWQAVDNTTADATTASHANNSAGASVNAPPQR